ncbi:hypothetical protein NMS90_004469 [Vibrio alginolyticus]|nr:hypothetical protein [Vibrio alginolyticus]
MKVELRSFKRLEHCFFWNEQERKLSRFKELYNYKALTEMTDSDWLSLVDLDIYLVVDDDEFYRSWFSPKGSSEIVTVKELEHKQAMRFFVIPNILEQYGKGDLALLEDRFLAGADTIGLDIDLVTEDELTEIAMKMIESDLAEEEQNQK